MKWWVKIAAFKALSLLPGGSSLYRWSQENITNSLVPTPERVRQKISVGASYFQCLRTHGLEHLLVQGSHLDLGAGWHPTLPLLFYCLGCPSQTLADVVPVMTRETARQTCGTFLEVLSSWDASLPLRPDRRQVLQSYPWPSWPAREIGWDYQAPYMEWLRHHPPSLGLVTSTQALLHVPRTILRSIFTAVTKALKPGGVFMATIHLRDLFADADPTITPYNHLRYSPFLWNRVISSPLMSYNRLKAPDYRELLQEAGLRILEFHVSPGDPSHLEKIRVHPCFSSYSREELAADHLFVAAQKP